MTILGVIGFVFVVLVGCSKTDKYPISKAGYRTLNDSTLVAYRITRGDTSGVWYFRCDPVQRDVAARIVMDRLYYDSLNPTELAYFIRMRYVAREIHKETVKEEALR